MQQAHIFVSGYVQGVGYREFTKKVSRRLGLTGWVRNLPDRRVEAIIQGNRNIIEELLVELKKGSYISEVESLSIEWEDIEESFETFEILR